MGREFNDVYISGFGKRSNGKISEVGLSLDERCILSFREDDDDPGQTRTTEYGDFICTGKYAENNAVIWVKTDKNANYKGYSQNQTYRKKQSTKKSKVLKELQKLEAAKNNPPVSDRDEWYKKLIETNPLSGAAKEKLFRERNINSLKASLYNFYSNFCSLTKKSAHKVKDKAPQKTPGVLWNDDLVVGSRDDSDDREFIGFPLKNYEGQIQGFQTSPLELKENDQKYKWLSYPKAPVNLQENGELPVNWVNCMNPDSNNNCFCLVVEGVLKSYLTALKHGINTLGVVGGDWIGCFKQIKETLNKAKKDCPFPEDFIVVLAPDANDVSNNQTRPKLQKFIKLLEKEGFDIFILWWGQYRKPEVEEDKETKGDIDEIRFTFNNMTRSNSTKVLSTKEFEEVLRVGEFINKQLKASKEEHEALELAKNYKYTIKEINCRYVSEEIDWSEHESGVVIMKSPMNTGKTQLLAGTVDPSQSTKCFHPSAPNDKNTSNNCIKQRKGIVQELQERDYKDSLLIDKGIRKLEDSKIEVNYLNLREVIGTRLANLWLWNGKTPFLESRIAALGSRIGLLRQMSKKIGLELKNDLEGTIDDKTHIALCVDSLASLDVEKFARATLILDEIVSVIKHLFIGGTCAKNRPLLIKKFEDLLLKVLSTGGRLILLDANLNQSTMRCLNHLLQKVEVRVGTMGLDLPKVFIQNNFKNKENAWNVEMVSGHITSKNKVNKYTSDLITERILKDIKSGIKSLVVTDSCKDARAIFTKLKKAKKKGMIITSKEKSKFANKFLENPEKVLEEKKYDFVVVSPTVESGLSIEGNYIQKVFAIFYGVVDPDTAVQMLGRVRENVPRIVWAIPNVIAQCATRPENMDRSKIERVLNKERLLQEGYQNLLNTSQILQTGEFYNKFDNGIHKKQAIQNLQKVKENVANVIWSELTVKSNRESSQYREEIVARLKLAGHKVNFTSDELIDDKIGAKIAEVKDALEKQESQRIAQAPEISLSKASQLAQLDLSDKPELQAQVSRAFLQDAVNDQKEVLGVNGDFLNTEIVHQLVKDDNKILRQMQLLAQLENPEKFNEKALFKYFVEIGRNSLFSSQSNHRLNNIGDLCLNDLSTAPLKNQKLLSLNISQFFLVGSSFTLEEFSKWVEQARNNKSACKLLGIRFKEGEEITVTEALKQINKLLGMIGLKLARSGSKFVVQSQEIRNESWSLIYEAVEKRLLKAAEESLKKVKDKIKTENEGFNKPPIDDTDQMPF